MNGMGQTIHDNAFNEGENCLAKLINYLITHGKADEVQIATTDQNARKEMYKKYHIID